MSFFQTLFTECLKFNRAGNPVFPQLSAHKKTIRLQGERDHTVASGLIISSAGIGYLVPCFLL